MSLRRAIDEKCKDCIYDDQCIGTWRQQVSLCRIKSCPLWGLRAKPTRPIPLRIIARFRAENEKFQPKDGV